MKRCPSSCTAQHLGKYSSCDDEYEHAHADEWAVEQGGNSVDGPGYWWLLDEDEETVLPSGATSKAAIIAESYDGSIFIERFESMSDAEREWEYIIEPLLKLYDLLQGDE